MNEMITATINNNVIIRDRNDEEIFFILNVKNYDRRFAEILHNAREKYEKELLDETWQNENGEVVGIYLDEYLLLELSEAGYIYESIAYSDLSV